MKVLTLKRYFRRISSFQWFIGGAILINIIVYLLLSHRRNVERPLTVYGRRFEELLLRKYLPDTQPGLVIVLFEFEFFDNRVAQTVEHVHTVVPEADVVVVSNDIPYPPLNLPDYAQLLVTKVNLKKSQFTVRPELFIKKQYVLIMPDAHEVISQESLEWVISDLEKQPADVKMIAWPANGRRDVQCLGLDADIKKWTLKYFKSKGICDALHGTFFLLMRREYLLSLPKPFTRPMRDAFFIQTVLRGWKIKYRDDFTYRRSGELYQDPHLNWKHKSRDESRQKSVYKEFGIKLVHTVDGREKWMGCTKESQRCFGTVVKDMPEYIYEGRWTPPCCLHALRLTARHVFAVLENQGVRYWLEGGSLLGAVRHGDIIPWDYDVDIGIYQEDIPKCMHLLKCDFQPYEDPDRFVWERATEGDFFRVQFSSTNRLHVDIFPFFSRNGTMTKKNWFKSHKQDTEFPEHYLNPLVKIDFVGVQTYAPNNYKDFLEFKFGKGVIENPKFPDQSKAV